ncbi:MAG TPA: xanthine dehydrogenase family protein subunit M [Anaerovoracaceae bacterium]|nr:xanthine dehydrogenase family protein subunit M [Anaerovoracaceae bacterium]
MRFDKYYEPTTALECCRILKEYGSDAKVLAGGTDVVPRLKNKIWRPKAIVSICKLPDIDTIAVQKDSLELGAAARLRRISLDKSLEKDYRVIMEAAGNVSSMQVRNIATIGGNACNASPSADAIQGLMAMDAKAVIAGSDGIREVAIEDFFTGPGTTVLKEGEFLLKFKIFAPKAGTGAVYKKFAIRGDTDISIVGVACQLILQKDGTIEDARISLAAVAPKPIRASEAEKLLTGKKLTEELINQAGEAAANSCAPITDQRATAEYRKQMVGVWTRHAVEEAAERAKIKLNDN